MEKGVRKSKNEQRSVNIQETRCMLDKERNVQPPDGGWGWVVVFASFLIHLVIDGIAYSFGVFYNEFLEVYKGGKGETAWVGSLVPGAMLLFGPLAGLLTDKFGCRFTTVVGALITAAGFVLSTFAPTLYFLYFSFGILSGLGFGLIFLPAVVSVGHYFEKRRALAVGIACTGSGIGAFIFNPFSKFLIDYYGWRGAILIQAGILLNCIVFGAFFRPLKQPTTTDEKLACMGHNLCDNFNVDIPLPTTRSSSFHESRNSSSQSLPTGNRNFHQRQREGNSVIKESMHKSSTKRCCLNVPVHCKASMAKLCDFSKLKNTIFIMFLVSNVVSAFGITVFFIFLYDFAVEQGIDDDKAKWLGSIIGITNTCGRVFCGLFADRPKVNKVILFSAAVTILGASIFLCSLCSTYALLVVVSSVFGLCFGIYVPLMSVVLADLLGLEMLNNAFGVMLMFKGIACLIGPPCAGWLYDATGNYIIPFIVSGVTTAASGIMLIFTPWIRRHDKYKNKDIDDAERKKLNNTGENKV